MGVCEREFLDFRVSELEMDKAVQLVICPGGDRGRCDVKVG